MLKTQDFPGDSAVKNLPANTCQFRRHGFEPWVVKIPWRRKWQPTPVFLPGKAHGQRSLADYSPWDRRVGHHLGSKQQYVKSPSGKDEHHA